MTLFVDTSAFYALMDRDDTNHPRAAKLWRRIVEEGTKTISSNYTYLESMALIQSRLGMHAAKVFHQDLYGLTQTEWVDSELHLEGVSRLFSSGRRRLSLVDCVSFAVMDRLKIKTAFAFDSDFKAQGFLLL